MTDNEDDDERDRTRRRSRREIDRAIDDLGGAPDPDRTASWRRYLDGDLDAADPLHRLWITAGADEPMTDADARAAIERINQREDADADRDPVEQAAAECVRELDAERERTGDDDR